MHKKKPDALLILALVFGLGVLVSAISHGSSDSAAPEAVAMYQSVAE